MTPSQDKYIRENHRRQAIAEMARNLKLLPDEVLEFMTVNRLATTRPCIVARTNHVDPYKRTGRKYFTDSDKLF